MNLHFGHLARTLHWCTDQAMTAELEKMDLTAAQGRILGYLAHIRQPLCPRDIENKFHLSHPTVSGILSRLEQKEFIRLQTDPDDRRIKRIFVLPKGEECHDRIHRAIDDNEARMVAGFTEEERQLFADLLQRAIQNMGAGPCQTHFKEEGNS